MVLKAVKTGMLESNCYILGDSGEAAVIDPGADLEEIMQALDEHGLTLKYIIYTHAHFDHVAEGDKLRRGTGAKVVIHEDEAPILEDPILNGSAIFWSGKSAGSADMLVRDADVLKLGNADLEIIHTPGHTPGGMCILIRTDSCIFTGDTLFRLSVGRTDLGAGNTSQLMVSLQRLMELGDEVKVYPGHGPSTQIGYERKNNPWL